MSSFFKVKDENGNWVSPETEKMIDQTYDPTSENAQSGVAIHGLIGDLPEEDFNGDKPENLVNLMLRNDNFLRGGDALRQEEIMALDERVTVLETSGGGDITVDQTYSPESPNAQSGTAVAQAMATKQDKFAEIEGEAESSLWTMTIPKDLLILGNNLDIANNTNFTGELKQNNSPLANQDFVTNITDNKQDKLPIIFAGKNEIFLSNDVNICTPSNQQASIYFKDSNIFFGHPVYSEYVGLIDNKLRLCSATGVDFDNCKIIKLATPTEDTDAVNKLYVDTLIGDIETALDNIIALQESLIGGASE